jgi:4-hydroxythreonine-4-phosphate dehydrogenase
MKTKRSKPAIPVIAVTSGDPSGIGPEIVSQLFSRYRPGGSSAVIIGSPTVFARLPERLDKKLPVFRATGDISREQMRKSRMAILDSGYRGRYVIGRDCRGGGQHAGSALETAIHLVQAGAVDAIVTAPISKKALSLAGYSFTGHTEMFARYFDAPNCQMVMVHRDLRVVPLTRHIPLRRVSAALTVDGIVTALNVLRRALVDDFGIPRPRIAVAGLNPHAGDGGVLGGEELSVIAPALTRARRRGIRVTGPVAGDALFLQAGAGTFDAFVAMYHDQGLIPFKMLAKRRGVNVTVGLPVVRTSVDHGVAFDIARHGVASDASLKQAYLLAEKLVRRAGKRKPPKRSWKRATS